MFASSKRLGAIQNYIFFNDKELPKGSISERFVNPFLERFDNPKGNSAYKLFSIMSKEKKLVAKNTVCIQVTPAQQNLLKLLSHQHAEEYFAALKHVHYTSTYCVNKDLLDLWKNGCVHDLLDVVREIKDERGNN